MTYKERPCEIIILGASGDLSRRKLMPALFSLYSNGLLPESFRVIGYARSPLSDQEFRDRIADNLTCRYLPDPAQGAQCEHLMDEFLARCFYFTGRYDDEADFRKLQEYLTTSAPAPADRMVYMAVPPAVFLAAATGLVGGGLLNLPAGHWSRVVLEKPFGRDSQSSKALVADLSALLQPEQIYRIDHYLGKEVIQNLLVLRFANTVFEPLWNRQHIEYVKIAFSEDIGCEGRAGYFDSSGIIRDVIQNHLLQILALVAMEHPVTLSADDLADEKAKVLRCVQPLKLADLLLGQYTAAVGKKGYLDDPEVPRDSRTETFAHATLRINNARWSGVPFYLSAGKALPTRETTIQIKFRPPAYALFTDGCPSCYNDLHIRVQPDEAIELHLASRVPGFDTKLRTAKLDMLYRRAFDQVLPDAYERLLLDVIRGDRRLFIQERELAASWDIVTPLLQEMQQSGRPPLPYPFGSTGPKPL